MATTPPPARDRKLIATGTRFLIAGVALAVVGVVLVMLLEGLANGIGVVAISFACILATAGLALIGSGIVSRRSREDKPFA